MHQLGRLKVSQIVLHTDTLLVQLLTPLCFDHHILTLPKATWEEKSGSFKKLTSRISSVLWNVCALFLDSNPVWQLLYWRWHLSLTWFLSRTHITVCQKHCLKCVVNNNPLFPHTDEKNIEQVFGVKYWFFSILYLFYVIFISV